MSRVQLALNVTDLEKAIEFYSKLFGAEPAKRKPGYANFAIADPPLKLVLFEHAAAHETRASRHRRSPTSLSLLVPTVRGRGGLAASARSPR
jgi:catechol 2,3-dioxygenase-like lactoylglutathione lyase family enzyme